MATLEQLSTALRNADAAGDTQAAQALASEIRKLQTAPAAAPAPPSDPYRQAAIEDRQRIEASGTSADAGMARLAIQGATFNTADEVLAGLRTPMEMIRRGTFDPREGYKHAKAQEDLALEEGRKKAGYAATAAELAGGIMTGSGLARGGVSAMRFLGPNAGIGARSAAAAADAGLMGAVAGGAEGNSLEERGMNALTGGATGVAVGGAMPGLMKAGGAVLSPLTSQVGARLNPERYARNQVARAIMESSRTPAQIADDVALAAREGQGMFTVADSMGNPGQRMLSTVARSPGVGRTNAVEFLEQRQAGQGRRIANALMEGFDTPTTAAQTRTAMTAARDTAADRAYGAARAGAGPVDVSRVVANIDDTLQPGVNRIVNPQSGIADDSIESALASVRSRLTDGRSVQTDFTSLQRLRSDLSDRIQVATRAGRGNQARMLGQALRELDTAMENASPGFRAANRQFAQSSRNIDAIDEGTAAAMRGRTEDTIPAFRNLSGEGQQGFRAGYVDPLVQQTQGAAMGVNKARPLINDAFADEVAAIAPQRTQAQMQRRIGRENTMFETRAQALGGSRTADNLADEAAMGADPSMIANLISGNWGGVARGAMTAGQNALTGNTPAVREEVSRILLMRGGNVTPQQMQGILEQAVQRIQLRQLIMGQAGRGLSGGLAVAPATQQQGR